MLETIGSRIDSVVKINFQTDNERHGRFARMVVKPSPVGHQTPPAAVVPASSNKESIDPSSLKNLNVAPSRVNDISGTNTKSFILVSIATPTANLPKQTAISMSVEDYLHIPVTVLSHGQPNARASYHSKSGTLGKLSMAKKPSQSHPPTDSQVVATDSTEVIIAKEHHADSRSDMVE
ncbi:hypothetical protein V6N12_044877 [Hibiscus sabdariffa]|uniref:Uncharacterized protein n=1 Tax=Hibiscus sabdariffa TaxID=183260 RepID=A0ABR2A566_9ROSI